MNELAVELGCDWHTVNDTVLAFGTALIDDDPNRIGTVTALGLHETLFVRQARGDASCDRPPSSMCAPGACSASSLVAAPSSPYVLAEQGEDWLNGIDFAALNISGPYRTVFDSMLPGTMQVADPFHLMRLSNAAVDECRRRVQNDTLGHRGRKRIPLYRCGRLSPRPTSASTRRAHQASRPAAGRRSTRRGDHGLARQGGSQDALLPHRSCTRPGVGHPSRHDLQDSDCPHEVRRLGRTLIRWRHQIAAWHQAQVSNGPTEAVNNLIKRIKRVAFGFSRFRNYRIRTPALRRAAQLGPFATIAPR